MSLHSPHRQCERKCRPSPAACRHPDLHCGDTQQLAGQHVAVAAEPAEGAAWERHASDGHFAAGLSRYDRLSVHVEMTSMKRRGVITTARRAFRYGMARQFRDTHLVWAGEILFVAGWSLMWAS